MHTFSKGIYTMSNASSTIWTQVTMCIFFYTSASINPLYIYIYIYIHISSHAARTDFLDSLSPFIPIIYHFQQVFQTTSCVSTELLYISSCWSPNTGMSMCRRLLENITYEFVFASPTVSCMSFPSYLDGFRDRRWVVLQLLFHWMLFLGFVQCSSYSSWLTD